MMKNLISNPYGPSVETSLGMLVEWLNLHLLYYRSRVVDACVLCPHTHGCMYPCMHVQCSEDDISCPAHHFLPYSLKTRSVTEPKLHHWLAWLARGSWWPCHLYTHHSAGVTATHHYAQLFVALFELFPVTQLYILNKGLALSSVQFYLSSLFPGFYLSSYIFILKGVIFVFLRFS